jgi:putative ubiquitin-RnfH superfamily antitoxin RatB of RatAB toxin-antitoxin module
MTQAAEIAVEVVYALPGEQVVAHLRLAAAATVGEAIQQSGLLRRYPQIDPAAICAGVFGIKVALDAPLNDGDRVEIYRPLTVDPKEARRRRVALRAAAKPGA